MDKTVILGDTHGRSFWKLIVAKEKPTQVIFIGDYFDSPDFSAAEQIHNFKEIVQYKEDNPQIEVILLIGNHDHHYFYAVGNTGTSGYQIDSAFQISLELEERKSSLQMAYLLDDVLFTHAGVTPTWLEHVGWGGDKIDDFINDVWKHKPKAFNFYSYEGRADSSGNNIWQSPIWVRPRALMQDGHEFKKHFIQVVGHTGQKQIDIEGKATGGRYYFIDTLGTSGEYLIYEDKKFRGGQI